VKAGDVITHSFDRGEPIAATVTRSRPVDGGFRVDLVAFRPGHASPLKESEVLVLANEAPTETPENEAPPVSTEVPAAEAPQAPAEPDAEEIAGLAEHIVLNHTVGSLKGFLAACEDAVLLAAMKAAESERETPRTTAVNAIEERLGELATEDAE
jgi:hypothetical protein